MKDYTPIEFMPTKETIFKDYIQKNTEFNLKNKTPFKEYSYSLIIPAYNEENRIGPFIQSLIKSLYGRYEIIVIFDGTDKTPEVIRKIDPSIRVITSEKRLGKGGAIIRGFSEASNEVIGFVDADNSISVDDVAKLANMVNDQNPCVIGSRWVKSSIIFEKEPILNIFAGRVFHYLVFMLLGLRIKDTQCGVKFFHRDIIKEILPKITVKSRMIDVALLYHVKLMKVKISEIGVTWTHNGGTKLPILRVIPLMFATIVGLRIIHSEYIKPKKRVIKKLVEEFDFY